MTLSELKETAAVNYQAVSRFEAIEEWARARGNQTLIRDKTALAILTLAQIVHEKEAPIGMDILDKIPAAVLKAERDFVRKRKYA